MPFKRPDRHRVHSTLETEDRSKDGGYIRSGICYKIPDNAKYVRFLTATAWMWVCTPGR